MGKIANDLTADYSQGARGVFIRLTPPIIACSFLIGLLFARPNVEDSGLATFRVKADARSDSQSPIEGKIVYVLSKFVIVFRPWLANSPINKDELVALNVDEIAQIGQWPEPYRWTPSPNPSLTTQKPQQ